MRLKTSADDSVNYRYSGILVHPTSFPSPYGIGDFGKGAYDFIDFLEAAGQHLWQILPLNPITSHGNSPYQGFSVFAGEPLLISPELLKARGLLREEDLREDQCGRCAVEEEVVPFDRGADEAGSSQSSVFVRFHLRISAAEYRCCNLFEVQQ